MYKFLIYIGIVSLLFSCSENQTSIKPSCACGVAEDSIAFLTSQMEDSWNAGDIEGFMSSYWKSDSLTFIGKSGVNRGWTTTLNNYKKAYPGKEGMGKLKLQDIEYKTLGECHTLVLGSWNVERSADTLAGHYSIIWKCLDGRWIIISDHSS